MSKENEKVIVKNYMSFKEYKSISIERSSMNAVKDKRIYFYPNGKIKEKQTGTYTEKHNCEPDVLHIYSRKRECWDDKGLLTSLEFQKTFFYGEIIDLISVVFNVKCNFDREKKVYLFSKYDNFEDENAISDSDIIIKLEKKYKEEFDDFVKTATKSIRTAIGRKPLIDEEVLRLCKGDVQKAIKMMKKENQNIKGDER